MLAAPLCLIPFRCLAASRIRKEIRCLLLKENFQGIKKTFLLYVILTVILQGVFSIQIFLWNNEKAHCFLESIVPWRHSLLLSCLLYLFFGFTVSLHLRTPVPTRMYCSWGDYSWCLPDPAPQRELSKHLLSKWIEPCERHTSNPLMLSIALAAM